MLDGPLMSRNLATRFGSYVDGNIDSDYRKKGNPNDRTIFVMIASYRDWQCRYSIDFRYTVESVLRRAKFPNRIRIGIINVLFLFREG